ncbi:sulfurtransferase-like selenium metabolism protein YedF [Alkaliphilus sp. MSJ-5]|uniref:Sulfurtransferase-like selenium metabolism protein YedF n=1 Tax=Alkaliphilus flagellatus TaxID=2841507 RepID=A0ABS6G7V6_9FIRM|nr:sulfurtransferase-like selenium metabolism protein YedF [Alkaliphilus flagellatus]MBU5678199.1 sulfurtransferase-like selenium metabolism protein YedF [Alkaliphilus flagellatus]
MNKEVDARGMNCPMPVIHTKKALESINNGKVTTIVDNEVAKENVSKLAKSMDLKIDIKQNQGNYYIDIFKNQQTGVVGVEALDVKYGTNNKKDLVILISKNSLGEGSEELGILLMKSYLYALTEVTPYPKSILLLNGGVKLAIEDSEVVEHLRSLESNGVEVLSCGTCLDYFKIKDKLAVGGISNMYTIVERLNNASNTIKL